MSFYLVFIFIYSSEEFELNQGFFCYDILDSSVFVSNQSSLYLLLSTAHDFSLIVQFSFIVAALTD